MFLMNTIINYTIFQINLEDNTCTDIGDITKNI